MSEEHYFIVKVGVYLVGIIGNSILSIIDLFFVFPWSVVWYYGFLGFVGVDFDGSFWGVLIYNLDFDLWVVFTDDAIFYLEYSLMLGWVAIDWFKFQFGYKLVWG